MNRFLAPLAAAIALAAPCAADAATAEVMLNWNPAEMRSVVTGLGMTVLGQRTDDKGFPVLEVKSANGFNFEIYGTECKGAGAGIRCDGAEFVATIDYDTPSKADRDLAQIDYAALKYYKQDDDTIALSRYIIFDDGITRQNLEVNLRVFVTISERIWKM